jgi:hypothetical protein
MRSAALGVALVVGCASSSQSPDVTMKPPFSAQQIRAATRAGRRYVWRTTTPGGAETMTLRFRAVDDSGATLESDDGRAPRRVTWDELEGHARFPADRTTRSEDTVEVPAGSFEAWVYETRDPPEVKRTWFARELPGAPVKQEVRRDGVVVFTMELLEHGSGD